MAHAGHTLTAPKPDNGISSFFFSLRSIVGLRLFVCHVAASPMAKASHWSSFDRWPSFVRLSRGCFTNGEGIALANVRSFAFVCLSVTWLFLQWRRHCIGPRPIIGFCSAVHMDVAMALVGDRTFAAIQYNGPGRRPYWRCQATSTSCWKNINTIIFRDTGQRLRVRSISLLRSTSPCLTVVHMYVAE